MSSRALYRASTHALSSSSSKDSSSLTSSEDEVDTEPYSSFFTSKSSFAALSQEEEEVKDEEQDSAKNSNVLPIENAPSASHDTTEGSKTSSRTKKKKKKNTSKAMKNNTNLLSLSVPSEDDFLGGELSSESNTNALSNVTLTTSKPLLPCTFLKLDRKNFDDDAELKRHFGSAVVREDRKRRVGEMGRGHYQGGLKRSFKATHGSILPPHSAWSRLPLLDLSVLEDPCSTDQPSQLIANEECHRYSYVYGPAYETAQMAFLVAVEGHDPNALFELLRTHPSHVDTLLAVSDVLRSQGSHNEALACLKQALYVLETASSASLLTSSSWSYNTTAENRSLFRTILKLADAVGRKGCWKTAFEWSKLLLALDADLSDPLGSFYIIDFYALQSKQFSFFLDGHYHTLFQHFYRPKVPSDVPYPPNYYYSQALAYFLAALPNGSSSDCSNMKKASDMLKQAVLTYPLFLLLLMEKGPHRIPDRLLSTTLFLEASLRSEGTPFLTMQKLHVERVHHLWSSLEVVRWLDAFLESLMTMKTELEIPSYNFQLVDMTPDVTLHFLPLYRHVYLLEPSNVSYSLPTSLVYPPDVPLLKHDPFPPEPLLPGYSTAFWGSSSTPWSRVTSRLNRWSNDAVGSLSRLFRDFSTT